MYLRAWFRTYERNLPAVTLYVAKTGSDANPGTSALPFLTIQKALQTVIGSYNGQGATVLVGDGTYTENLYSAYNGSAQKYLTIKSINPRGAKVVGPATTYSAIVLQTASYVRIEGLDVQADKGHGIDAYQCHHIQVVNNYCHHCGGGGISLQAGDYYLAEGNECAYNVDTNIWQPSAISIYQARAYDQAPGYHIYVLRNFLHHNMPSHTGLAQTTDGNGLIIDDFHNSQDQPGSVEAGPYAPSSLVENNICAYNGGFGILTYHSDNVTVRHNTCVFNSLEVSNQGNPRGELGNSSGSYNRFYNNIAITSSAQSANAYAVADMMWTAYVNTGVELAGNLLHDINKPTLDSVVVHGAGNPLTKAGVVALNKCREDAKFIGGASTFGGFATTGDFRLQPSSPAVDAAILAQSTFEDFTGRSRFPKVTDIGARDLKNN